jgi:hypothetical protein
MQIATLNKLTITECEAQINLLKIGFICWMPLFIARFIVAITKSLSGERAESQSLLSTRY